MLNVFILNKNTLKSDNNKICENISKICIDNGLNFKILMTESIEELRNKISYLKEKNLNDVVFYAVGGDGTFQSLVNEVDLTKTILQYLPFGTGNNSYRTFYNQVFDLKNDILSQQLFSADLGKANEEYFVSMAGLGLDAKVGKNVEKFRKCLMPGKVKYYFSILNTLMTERDPVKLKLSIDGNRMDNYFSLISIANGPTIGGRTPMAPDATAFDGKLNAIITNNLQLHQMITLFSKIDEKGSHLKNENLVKEYLFENMNLESQDALLYELDGEIRYNKKVEISVCPKIMTLKGRH